MSLLEELKRRNVFRVGIAYLLMAWVLLQAADFALDLVDAPNWVIQTLTVLAALGLPVALFFAWAFELTPEGVKREHEVDRSQSITPKTGRKLDRFIILVLAIAVTLLLVDRFIAAPGAVEPSAEKSAPSASTTGINAGQSGLPVAPTTKSVAVLPFVAMSNGEDDEFFADGLTEEILNALAQLPTLSVTSRTSAFTFKGQDLAVAAVARQLGVGHVVEGSVRRSGDRLRVTAQLIRADDDSHLWSDTYDSTSEDAITVQEDIAVQVARALDVVLDDRARAEMHRVGLRDVTAFVEFQKARRLYTEAHDGDSGILALLSEANQHLERVIERVPGYGFALVLHADLFTHLLIAEATGLEIEEEFRPLVPEALDRFVADYELAARHASSPARKFSREFDLAFVSGNWRGMRARLELMGQQTSCVAPAWGDMLSTGFGYVDALARLEAQVAQCDPLYARAWIDLAVSRIWANETEAAFEALANIPETQRPTLGSMAEVLALLQVGRLEDASRIADGMIDSESAQYFTRTAIAAAAGREEEARSYLARHARLEGAPNFREVSMYAMVGDREMANRLAAQIDQHPQGYLALPMVVNFCLCGAPWDIDQTPNFKARFEQTGLEWPPISPLQFPLKDW